MKTLAIAALLVATTIGAHAKCDGQVVHRPDRKGVMREYCLDGKYLTCIADSQRSGYSEQQARTYCDRLKVHGMVK